MDSWTWKSVVITLLICITVSVIVGLIVQGVESGHERDRVIAKVCLDNGGIWIDNRCLFSPSGAK